MITILLSVDEGVMNKVYKDTAGNRTIGVGFNMDNPQARGTWIKADIPESFTAVYVGTISLSDDSVTKLFNTTIKQILVDTRKLYPAIPTYPDTVQLALVNLAFNLGITKLKTFNTFNKYITESKFPEAAEDLLQTAWYSQVGNRGDRVVALLKGDDSQYGA